MRRVFLIVLDSLGIGNLPDARLFGDGECNTLRRIAASPLFSAENLKKLGLFHIEGAPVSTAPLPAPCAAYGRMAERSLGKDTTTGHWELAGLISETPFPTYPDGFPKEILDPFMKKTGRGILCNRPYSGTEVIRDYGEEHIRTGKLIVYTSADSVFQIAAHEDVVPPETLYRYCEIARSLLTGKHAVGRVIARPFVGDGRNGFARTGNRRDFSVAPPKRTLLDDVKDSGKAVIAIGKIRDIFSGQGITEAIPTHSNREGMDALLSVQKSDFCGLCFLNLVDFDMVYGHREDIDGYAAALTAFDSFLPIFLSGMREDDLLVITADHGCDPGDGSTDHTREYVPLLVYGKNVRSVDLGTRESFADVAATVRDCLFSPTLPSALGAASSSLPLGFPSASPVGKSFFSEIL